ncbi:MAG: hypothetical protein CMF59_13195 [Leptospiraceae bacterium]|nr:hypothetical protein [Leptospiraceae bacterium]
MPALVGFKNPAASAIRPGDLDFRTTWPGTGNSVLLASETWIRGRLGRETGISVLLASKISINNGRPACTGRTTAIMRRAFFGPSILGLSIVRSSKELCVGEPEPH